MVITQLMRSDNLHNDARMVSTRILLSTPGLTPPVFIAGSFTSWQPIELEFEESRDNIEVQHRFYKVLDIAPGVHQYKFRLGPGDWWICDDSTEQCM